MPATTKAQQIASAIAKHEPGKLYARNRGLLKMDRDDLDEFASTPRKGLPMRAKKGKRLIDQGRRQ